MSRHVQQSNQRRTTAPSGSLSGFFRWIFLPEGYPSSVSPDYLEYQLWDTLQGFCGYLKSMILTLSFLKGIGVGSSSTSLDQAMVVWVVRDTVGVASGLVAGLPTFTKHFSNRKHLKYWRLLSEGIRALGGAVEVASVYHAPPELYLVLSCVVIVLDTIAGVIGGQTRSALVSHFARSNNISDCAAKEGNQDRGVKVFGIPLALILLRQLKHHPALPSLAYAGLVFMQLSLNVLAVRALALDRREGTVESKVVASRTTAEPHGGTVTKDKTT